MVQPQNIIAALERRVGRRHLGKRLRLQVDHTARFFGAGLGPFHWENIELIPWLAEQTLRLSGLWARSHRNALAFETRINRIRHPRLPPGFHGLRILHLSDLHIDGMDDEGARLREVVSGLEFDLCVLTGDFRFLTFNRDRPALERTASLVKGLACPLGVVGILGNHDFIEMVPTLESAGIRMLLNEAVAIDRRGDQLWLLGIDDVHFYGVGDVNAATRDVPEDAFRILLSHSPEVYREASDAGIELILAGHTHGGQLCLPGGIPILTNAACPRRYTSGPWRHDNLIGYTSRGTGSSGIQARLNCPPEITVHELLPHP
jgi:uncharacterized protein